MNENELQSVPVPTTVPVPGKVPVPRQTPVSETVPVSQENSSDSTKFAIGIGIICLLLILVLLLLLLRNAAMSQQENTSVQQTAGETTTENTDTGFDNQGQETNQNSTENNNSQQSTETATSTEGQNQEQAQNNAETNDSDTKIQDDGHKKSAAAKQSEEKPQIESSENITQSEKTTDVSTQNNANTPSFQPHLEKHSENDANGYSDGFHQGDATVNIFNTTGKGTRFVFVFDHSGSMAGNPLEAAKRELTQCLTSLRDHHRFNIIFYDDQQLIWKPGDKLISAVKKNKKDAEQFIADVNPGGGTEPLPPLLMAIDYKPEIIFFLTDGDATDREFQPNGELALHFDNICKQCKKIRINVIQFGSNGRQSALLQKLARRTRGDYEYIDVKKFDAL
ncbi:MAG: VWA domain-containing protein [Planctomycetaceae bacterium]|jgi:Mg-chelatase subunit ChlD/uncharacterized protein YxeA|nr:VWA domain-containing protein [Planctomycetaceae bacterium]